MGTKSLKRTMVAAGLLVGGLAMNASAGSHLWRINEVFSNWDGTIQFIELHECCGAPSEWGLGGKKLVSIATGSQFTIPSNLTGSTANRYLLFATAGFAALPGAPTPNYIIPNSFFDPDGDTIEWSPIDNYDDLTWSGVMPNNGIDSMHITNYTTDSYVIQANSPTNYAGTTGSVNAGPPAPAVSTWGVIAVGMLVLVAGTLVSRKSAIIA